MQKLLIFLLLGVVAWQAYERYQPTVPPPVAAKPPVSRAATPATAEEYFPDEHVPASATALSQYSCDGRTHCSQMRSCDEAVYFLRHCPDTTMDGNNDGVPCERQWCN